MGDVYCPADVVLRPVEHIGVLLVQEIHVSYYESLLFLNVAKDVCYWLPEKQTCLSGII
jgi:hypothetical protein